MQERPLDFRIHLSSFVNAVSCAQSGFGPRLTLRGFRHADAATSSDWLRGHRICWWHRRCRGTRQSCGESPSFCAGICLLPDLQRDLLYIFNESKICSSCFERFNSGRWKRGSCCSVVIRCRHLEMCLTTCYCDVSLIGLIGVSHVFFVSPGQCAIRSILWGDWRQGNLQVWWRLGQAHGCSCRCAHDRKHHASGN